MFWRLLIFSLLATKACIEGADSSYRAAAYYVDWAIYGRNFTPQDLPAEKLTHVLYAFANINSTTGEVYLADTYADTDKHFAGDSWNDTGINLYGCLKQLYLLKKQNRKLKVLLSIGGFTYSSNFAIPASTSSGRLTFASSAASLVDNLGLDGLDIDWEYPENDAQASDFVLLLQAVREALDAYGNTLDPKYNFQLTVGCSAGPSYYQLMHLADMNGYVDFWNLMAYDYAGSWSSVTANQANLFSSASDPASTPFNTETAISYYISKGIEPSSIVLGMPIYGRSFEATHGLGMPFDGVGTGTWEAGVYDFKVLPLRGAIEITNNATGSSYSYDNGTEELISYDNVIVAKQKAAWIQQMGLGGAMWWESSADGVGNNSLILNVVEVLGGEDGSGLENSPNQLLYPDSIYDNLRAGMPASGSVPAAASTSSFSVSEAYSSASLSTSSLLTVSSSSATLWDSGTSSGPTLISPSATASDFSSSGSPALAQFTMSTVRSTSVSTIISCASTVENCPAQSTILTTVTVDISTTICPVTETSTGSSQPNSVSTSPAYDESFSGTTEVTSWASTSTLEASDTVITTSDSSVFISSSSTSPSLGSATVPSPSNSTYSSSSLSAIPSSLTSSTSSSLIAPTSLTSSTSAQMLSSSTLSSASATSTSTSSSDCIISGRCNTYKLFACPDGDCFCGQDINNEPTCFESQRCSNLRACSSDTDCAADEACGVKDCCGNGAGRCLRRAAGCMDSPAAQTPFWLPYSPSCNKIRKRSIIADTENIEDGLLLQAKRHAC